jgi:predicted choloylglycine hydrolase
MRRILQAIHEPDAGEKWQRAFLALEPGYRKWFFREGDAARPSYGEGLRALKQFMPELLPTYERLVDLAGGGDATARMLSLYRPTPYLTGCSQAAWTRDERFLVRNYDYSPALWDGILLLSSWTGRRVIGMVDSLWGVLDGINDAGLSVSLAFGGRRVVGDGFGMPLILRYVLEMSETAKEATTQLARIPTHMAYNVTVLDRRGEFGTAFLAPDRQPFVTRRRVATNHQGVVDWPAYASATATLDRARMLNTHIMLRGEDPERFVQRFLQPPLYAENFRKGWGTLYTAIYRPDGLSAEYRWPGTRCMWSIDRFDEKTVRIAFPDT